jgi:hypothetical protein
MTRRLVYALKLDKNKGGKGLAMPYGPGLVLLRSGARSGLRHSHHPYREGEE